MSKYFIYIWNIRQFRHDPRSRSASLDFYEPVRVPRVPNALAFGRGIHAAVDDESTPSPLVGLFRGGDIALGDRTLSISNFWIGKWPWRRSRTLSFPLFFPMSPRLFDAHLHILLVLLCRVLPPSTPVQIDLERSFFRPATFSLSWMETDVCSFFCLSFLRSYVRSFVRSSVVFPSLLFSISFSQLSHRPDIFGVSVALSGRHRCRTRWRRHTFGGSGTAVWQGSSFLPVF